MKEWLQKVGWHENPFNFKIYPDLMVGYKDELTRLQNAIDAENKFSIILGDTGAGKTNLLKWLITHCDSYSNVKYMPKPPKTEDNFLIYLKDELLSPNFIQRLFNSYSLYNIHHELDKKLDEPSLLIIDEGHEASPQVLEWVRTIIDHVDNLSVISAGLPEFKETLSENVYTLYNRATDVIYLNSLDKDETIDLVRKRIEKAGGSSLEPFTQSAIMKIYEFADGFPREILRTCNRCVVHAAKNDFSFIEAKDVEDIMEDNEVQKSRSDQQDEDEEVSKEVKEDKMKELTEKQKKVVEVMKDQGKCSSGEIADTLDITSYSSRSHAVRSINNILKRLMENGIVDRERNGRSYNYYLD